MREGKHHYIAVSVLIGLLVLTAVILNFSKPADLQAVVNQEVETKEEIIAEAPSPDFETVGENPYEAEDVPKPIEEKSCSSISFEVFCNTQHSSFLCKNINDGNLTSEWFAGYSCPDQRIPCVVNNYVDITADKPFQYIKLYNRIEPDFYINRLLLDYNDHSKVTFTGGQKYTQSPWTIELLEPTTEVNINIVEIMGVGYRYQTGLAEIELSDCLN